MTADLWRLNAVWGRGTVRWGEIAVTAGPMLQMPPRKRDPETTEEAEKTAAERDAGVRERSLDFLDYCWLEGAISIEEHHDYWARWEAEESPENPSAMAKSISTRTRESCLTG